MSSRRGISSREFERQPEALADEVMIMLSRRDFAVAAITLGLTLTVVKMASSETPVMKSTAVDWNDMQVRQTKFGSQRRVFQAPTATLDELECHITTLNAGEAPHPPHKH